MAPVLGSYVFFSFDDKRALENVQWVYLAIACFVFLLAVIFFVSVIPEITDADMAFQASETHADESDRPLRKQYRLFHAAFAQFCYTGSQVAIARYSLPYTPAPLSYPSLPVPPHPYPRFHPKTPHQPICASH